MKLNYIIDAGTFEQSCGGVVLRDLSPRLVGFLG
jgi:hypothetical protein